MNKNAGDDPATHIDALNITDLRYMYCTVYTYIVNVDGQYPYTTIVLMKKSVFQIISIVSVIYFQQNVSDLSNP